MIANYKLKRPIKGYNSEKERQFNQWSGISDWEVYFGDEKIGDVYYIGTPATDWAWDINDTKLKGKAPTRKDAFQDLIYIHKNINGEG
tara:strand:- start:257 stop:520 length:264 start_codon:yes stop_codon:yes gene_type:complete